MDIYTHEHKNKIVFELDENEFQLVAYLMQKSSRETEAAGIIKEPIDSKIWNHIKKYMDEN